MYFLERSHLRLLTFQHLVNLGVEPPAKLGWEAPPGNWACRISHMEKFWGDLGTTLAFLVEALPLPGAGGCDGAGSAQLSWPLPAAELSEASGPLRRWERGQAVSRRRMKAALASGLSHMLEPVSLGR